MLGKETFIVCNSVEQTKDAGRLPEEANKQTNATCRQVLDNDYPAAKIKTLFFFLINSPPPPPLSSALTRCCVECQSAAALADPGAATSGESSSRTSRLLTSPVFFSSPCPSSGPGRGQSSSEELEGHRHRSAGHRGCLLPHHHVRHPPHSK